MNVAQNAGYIQRLDEGADCRGALVTVEPDEVRDQTRDMGGSLRYKISYWRPILQQSTHHAASANVVRTIQKLVTYCPGAKISMTELESGCFKECVRK